MSGLGQKSLLRIGQSLRIEMRDSTVALENEKNDYRTHFFSVFLCSSLDSCNLSRLLVSESICDVLTDVFFFKYPEYPATRRCLRESICQYFSDSLEPDSLGIFSWSFWGGTDNPLFTG